MLIPVWASSGFSSATLWIVNSAAEANLFVLFVTPSVTFILIYLASTASNLASLLDILLSQVNVPTLVYSSSALTFTDISHFNTLPFALPSCLGI